MKPTVGRIVHYYPTQLAIDTHAPFAAIVSRVWGEDTVNLSVVPDGVTPEHAVLTSVLRSDAPTPGRWMWPPRA